MKVLITFVMLCALGAMMGECARVKRVKDGQSRGHAKGHNKDAAEDELDLLIKEVLLSDEQPRTESRKNERGNSLKLARVQRGKSHRVVRMEQYYEGLPVFGGAVSQLIIDEDTEIEIRNRQNPKQKTGKKVKIAKGARKSGDFVADIDGDLGEIDQSALQPGRALGKLKNKQKEDKSNQARAKANNNGNGKGNGKGRTRGDRQNKGRGKREATEPVETRRWAESSSSVVRMGEDGRAVVNYLVSFMVSYDDGSIEWPHALYDTEDNLVAKWNGLTAYSTEHMTGEGGNAKAGMRVWGTDEGKIPILRDGDTCFMANSFARVIDMETGFNDSKHDTYTWSCPEGDVHRDGIDVNGAYGVLNDALGAATLTLETLDNWYGFGMPADEIFWPLAVPRPLAVRAQYEVEYENAFWNEVNITLGNGHSTFHPLVTKDIVAHEIAHGITTAHSNLVYVGQSGGINEAFSDIVGITIANAYSITPDSWNIGFTAMKGATESLRYMDDPTKDGVSMAHTRDYVCNVANSLGNTLSPHYTSGVWNKVFVEFVKRTGWGLMDGLDIMLTANMLKWTALTNYRQAAEGVLELMDELKLGLNPPHLPYDYSHLNTTHMTEALDTVGITCAVEFGYWTCTDESSAGFLAPFLAC